MIVRARMPVTDCVECEGHGTTRDEDWDGRVYVLRCEACGGSGRVTTCGYCAEVASLPDVEEHGGLCGACAEEADRHDAEVMRRTGT